MTSTSHWVERYKREMLIEFATNDARARSVTMEERRPHLFEGCIVSVLKFVLGLLSSPGVIFASTPSRKQEAFTCLG